MYCIAEFSGKFDVWEAKISSKIKKSRKDNALMIKGGFGRIRKGTRCCRRIQTLLDGSNSALEYKQALQDCFMEILQDRKEEMIIRNEYFQWLLVPSDTSEAAINEQINLVYNMSYSYHAMYAYFNRDSVALKGLAKFFKESSQEKRLHVEKLMEYQGGKVKLQEMMMPISDYDHIEKGDALYAMELALYREELIIDKILNLQRVADRNNDVQLTDFVESELLAEQVESINKISEYVAQLRRVGKGQGVLNFDQMLLAAA